MYKNSKTGGYDRNGNKWTEQACIPHLWLIMPEDEDQYYSMGWYFNDECAQLHGPFNTMEEAVANLDNYAKELDSGVEQWFITKRDRLSESVKANCRTLELEFLKYGLKYEVCSFTKQFYESEEFANDPELQADDEERFMRALHYAMDEWVK